MKTWGTAPGRIAQRLRSNLHLQLLRGDYEAVLATTIPDEISDGRERAAAQSALDFYHGLAYLHGTPPEARRAAGIFKRLFGREPIPAHAINLLAARVGVLLGSNGFALLQGRDVQSAELALKEAEDRLATGSMNGVERAIHNSNRAALLLSLERPERAIEALRQVDIEHINAACMAYEAIALSRLDRKGEALALLVTATEKFGTVPIIEAVRAYLDDGAVRFVPVQTIDREETLQYLRAALQMLADIGIERQAAVRQHDHPPFERMMTDMVRTALASLSQMVWALEGRRGSRGDASGELVEEPRRVHHEDVYNTLVREILIALVTPFYRWSVADQSLGGFTEKGNAGERDLVVKKDLTEIAVIEAVKASAPGNTQLRKHFTKLPNYSNCKLFFHVTYAFSRAPSTILDAVHRMAENPPEGLTRLETEKIEQTDSQPPGVLVSYTDGERKITIVFLVVDLLQAGQRRKFVDESAASLVDSTPDNTQE
uniref:Tetratricopeptide repeat protein n=1 Tax=Burkholderia sp. (strain CCGE1003) TaxID=640512 RepID=E1TJ79_BURSG